MTNHSLKQITKRFQFMLCSCLLLSIFLLTSNVFATMPALPQIPTPIPVAQPSTAQTARQDRSVKSTNTTEVCAKFSNIGTVPLQLVWVGYDGVEVSMGALEAGKPQEFYGLEKQLFRIKQGATTIGQFILDGSAEQSFSAKASGVIVPKRTVVAGSPPRRKVEGTMTLINNENGQQIEGFEGAWSTPVSNVSRKTTVWRSSLAKFVKNANGTWTGGREGEPDLTYTVHEESTHFVWLANKEHEIYFRLHHGIATINDDQTGSYLPIMAGTWVDPQLKDAPLPESIKEIQYPLQIK